MHHGGDTLGSRAFLLVYPDDRVSVAIVANVSSAAIGEADGIEFAGLGQPGATYSLNRSSNAFLALDSGDGAADADEDVSRSQ